MTTRTTMRLAVGAAMAIGSLLAGHYGADAGEAAGKPVPPNTWVKVVEDGNGCGYQPLVYDPEAKCVRQFATVVNLRDHCSMDRFRHFDAGKLAWVDDEAPKKAGGDGRTDYDMAVYHPKTKEIVYGDGRAYDPDKRSWRNLGFKVELDGKEYPGAPPVWWGAMAYDPANDELVFFSGAGARNFDDYQSTGFVDGSFGTMTLSFKDKVWRRLRPGSEDFKKGRALLRDFWWDAGRVVEKAWRAELERAWNPDEHKKLSAGAAAVAGEVLGQAEKLAAEAGKLAAGLKDKEEKERLSLAADGMKAAIEGLGKSKAALESGKSYEGYLAAFEVVQKLRALYRFKVLAEPPPRVNAKLVYDPKNKCIVLFGGNHGDGFWNDTWIYDCATRKWRESRSETRPEPRQLHFICHHPKSGRILMGGGNTGPWTDPKPDMWAYDVAADKWSPVAMAGKLERGCDRYTSGYDEQADLVIVHKAVHYYNNGTTWVIRPDPSAAGTSKGAPAWSPAPPAPFPVPDDPAVLAGLKALPANAWVDAKCKDRAPEKDWGSIGYDPSSGFALLFGGGHSTYQGDDVTAYLPGANRWVYSHRPNNAAILPQLKNCMGGGIFGNTFQGGSWTHHQRNTYDGAGGRVLHMLMVAIPYPYGPAEPLAWTTKGVSRWPEWKTGFWEYDLDRRMWRTLFPEGAQERGELFPVDGRVVGILGGGGWREYDPATGKVTAHQAKGKLPGRSGEGRHYAYVPSRHSLLLVCNSPKAPARTYLYDLKSGEVKELSPKKSPPPSGSIANVLYMPDQDCAWARFGKDQWLYSFEKNTWAPAPFGPAPGRAFTGPYGKEIYSAKYKVLICGNGTPTYLLRPDMGAVKWE